MRADLRETDLIKKSIAKKGWIDLPAKGTSMYPLIREGDICRFSPAELSNIKIGDILLFNSPNQTLVSHRLINFHKTDSEVRYYFKGDTNLGYDEAVYEKQLIGKLDLIKKGKVKIRMENVLCRVWCRVILLSPISSVMLRGYLNKRENLM